MCPDPSVVSFSPAGYFMDHAVRLQDMPIRYSSSTLQGWDGGQGGGGCLWGSLLIIPCPPPPMQDRLLQHVLPCRDRHGPRALGPLSCAPVHQGGMGELEGGIQEGSRWGGGFRDHPVLTGGDVWGDGSRKRSRERDDAG